ncbi:MAG: cytochrome c-type biogenesis protein CcmH [Nitrospirota bacterium]|jgi:cytochrome c-type biogenesis protein CcmH
MLVRKLVLRKLLVYAAVTLAVVGAARVVPAASTHTRLTDPALQDRFHEISQQLICQCGCNLVLDVCNHHNCGSATPMRERIDRELLDGRSNAAIVAGFVDDMGLVVLSAPPASGFNLTAWLLPFVLLLVAAVVITLLLKRWRTLAPASNAGTAHGQAGEEGAHSDQIEEELREL